MLPASVLDGTRRGRLSFTQHRVDVGRLDVLALWRYSLRMATGRRTTIYLDPEVHKAIRLKAATTERSISDMVNRALRHSLAEDATDLEAHEERTEEESVPFEEFVKGLRRRGKL